MHNLKKNKEENSGPIYALERVSGKLSFSNGAIIHPLTSGVVVNGTHYTQDPHFKTERRYVTIVKQHVFP
jgi:hypothetical protein